MGWFDGMWNDSETVRKLRGFLGRAPAHPLLRRNRDFFTAFNQERPLTDYTFVVADTELTGLDPRADAIVSIGAVRVRGMRVDMADTYYSLVCPDRSLPKLSTLIHRITPQEVCAAPGMAEVLPGFVEYLGDSLLVGHHVGLDVTFLNRAARRVLGAGLYTPCLDTLRLAQVYQAELWEDYYDQFNLNVSYNLGHLARQYGLPLFAQHNALQDALQTAYLFLFLVRKLHRGGIHTLRDLYLAGRSWRWYF
ncbi:MAG: PolC-type DNA polymerase III [Desulfovibrionaceae bacterium]